MNYLSDKIEHINLITYNDKCKKKFKKNIKISNPYFNIFNFYSRYPKYFFCLITLIKTLVMDRNNLILTFQANIFVIIISKLLFLPVLSRSNSSPSGWSNNPFKQKIFSFFFKKADEIIVNSNDFKKEMDYRYSINTKCILNPFKFNEITKLSNVKMKSIFSKNVLKLISVGRLTDQKDFITLCAAIKNIKIKKVELIIIGKGLKKNEIEYYIKKNDLTDKIKLLGYQANPFKFIKKADIFILTSKFEGSPNVLVEAQFLKKYVISTNCPTGPKEILGNGKFGSLVKTGNYKKIAKIIDNFSFNRSVIKKINLGFKNSSKYNYKLNCNEYYFLISKYL